MDVLSVEGRHEGRLELVADLVADLVPRMLSVPQLAGDSLAVVVVAEELLEQSGRAQHVAGVGHEHVEELLLAGNEREAHRCS